MPTINRRSKRFQNKLRRWFLEGYRGIQGSKLDHQESWWKVMCLTGVDYFSTLGYQPGIAFLAAGLMSPFATLVLVIVTLCGAVPVYFIVARESPNGLGSISMLEKLLSGWKGKSLVLALLGFATTAFILTITLSAADATAHIVENPLVDKYIPEFYQNRIAISLLLICALACIFLKGFKEAIGISVALVSVYLVLNAITIGVSLQQLLQTNDWFTNWHTKLLTNHGSYWSATGIALLLFPKLALGLSGFETGVAVMPLVKGVDKENNENPEARIKNTQKLLLGAALIMSIFLIFSSLVTTLLIPSELFQDGQAANGRAISYLSHKYLGSAFGSAYDLSSILILAFAGASAMAGLLNLMPKYLPRYGMAPDWAAAVRPLVVFFTIVGAIVTMIFKADVDAQAGAYATGVLVLITSAALAATLHCLKSQSKTTKIFMVITSIFIYTTITNIIERPEGLMISCTFILTILFFSLLSRSLRSTELRIDEVIFDPMANSFLEQSLKETGDISLLAHRPNGTTYKDKERETRVLQKLTTEEASLIFLEVTVDDASEFKDLTLEVRGEMIEGYKVLRCTSAAVPNALAATLLHIRDKTGTIPHAYLGWTEGHPLYYVFKYIFLGEGETAPVTREILREVEKKPEMRPIIHVS